MEDIKKYSKLAKTEAEKIAQQVQEQIGDKDVNHMKVLTSELEKLSERNAELDRILKRLYEDHVTEKISDELFDKLLADYEKEQSDMQSKISNTTKQIQQTKANQKDVGSWIKLIRNYTRIKKLDRIVLSELVDKITIGEAKEIDGNKVTNVTIYYRFVGAVS